MMPNKPSRRWILRGIGGATLAIPSLPSLLAPKAAQAALNADDRIFIGIMSAYGGVWANKMFPALPAGAETMTYAGKKIRRAPLVATTGGGNTRLSDVMIAPSTVFPPSMADKITLLQGIDLPFDTNHHSAATFGNYAQGDGKVKLSGGTDRATIDQVIAQSPAFYRTLDGVTQRSVLTASFGELSFRNKVAGQPGSGVEKPPTYMNPESVWSALFGSAKPATPQRQSIVDLVYDDYTRLRSSPKLGAADRARLEDHVARIADIKRRQTVTISCASPGKPANPPDPACSDWQQHINFYKGFQDVLVAALACGLTRVVAQFHTGWNTTFGERCNDPWHQIVSHEVDKTDPQNSMTAAMQRQFSGVIMPLVSKLDSVKDASGKSLLDRSLVYWTQEHGVFSHAQENIPVVTFGSANGAFRTGQHLDYRDLTRVMPKGQFGDTLVAPPYVGLTWHQMLGSIAQGFGIPKTEWGEANHGGFGLKPANLSAASYNNRYLSWGAAEWNAAGEKLPWWLA